MLTNKLALAFVTIGALVAGLGCSAGAPGAGGDPELTRKGEGALSADALSGLISCQVTTDTYADCVVDPAYPVYSTYTLTVAPDDGSTGFDFDATTQITGKATTDGTPVRLTGYGFKGIWSWKPAPVVEQGAVATKTIPVTFAYSCFGTCWGTIPSGKKGPGPQLW